MKTEVFEYDDVIVQRKGCFRISIVLAFSRGWAKTNRMHDGWTHKKTPFLKLSGYVWTRPILRRFDSHNFAFWEGTTAFSCNHGGQYRVKLWKKVLKKPKVFEEK